MQHPSVTTYLRNILNFPFITERDEQLKNFSDQIALNKTTKSSYQ